MRAWFVIPTARPAREVAPVLKAWKSLGYGVALWADHGAEVPLPHDLLIQQPYRGYPFAVNSLTARLSSYEVVILGGDDVWPDTQRTARELLDDYAAIFPNLDGVMQPTGDPFGLHDSVCQCPWVGRNFIKNHYGGNGPLYSGYFHYFCDQELHDVAKRDNLLFKNPAICQKHEHWQRYNLQRPQHLKRAEQRWMKDKEIYESRKLHNFPGA